MAYDQSGRSPRTDGGLQSLSMVDGQASGVKFTKDTQGVIELPAFSETLDAGQARGAGQDDRRFRDALFGGHQHTTS